MWSPPTSARMPCRPSSARRPDGTEAYVRSIIEEQLPGDRGARAGQILRCLLRGGRVHGRPVAADPEGRGGVRDWARGCTPTSSHRRVGPNWRRRLGAASADHLAAPSDAGMDALAQAAADGRAVVATLLPATTWFLMKDHGAPARRFIERGIPVAIGTDFNPGTSPTASLPLAMTVACVELRMTPDEALSAVTINAARALGLEDEIGSLEPGKVGGHRHLARPDLDPDPVLAGREPGPDRRQARPRGPRSGLGPAAGPLAAGPLAAGSGLLAAGLEQDRSRLGWQVGGRDR